MRFPQEELAKRLPCQPRPHHQPGASSAGRPKSGEKRRWNRRWQPGEYLPGVEMFLQCVPNRCGTLVRQWEPVRERLQACRDTSPAIRRAEGFLRRDRQARDPRYADLPDGGCHSRAAGCDCRCCEIRHPAAKHTWMAEGSAHPDRPVDGHRDYARRDGPNVRPGRDHSRDHLRVRNAAGPGGHCHGHFRDHARNAWSNSELG